MRIALYIRVSTDEQAKHGYSLDAQKEKLEAFCKSQGWGNYETYIDDGYSAKDLNRPKFNLMKDAIKKGTIDVLLVYRLDRLTRSVIDLYEILKMLDENGCKFKSATEVYDTTNAMGRLFITLIAAIAQWERENLAERVKMGIEKKVKFGKWPGGLPPYGYVYKNDELIINPEEAKVVKLIFSMAKTLGFYTIAKRLTETGYSTKNGGQWHVDTVRGIANNPVYAGYLTHNDSPKAAKKPPREQALYEGEHERIVLRDEFWQLQEILEKRRGAGGKRETSNYYFSSILKCGRCGSSMSGHKTPAGKTYRCSGKKAGKSCTSHIVLEKYLVQKVFESFDDLISELSPQADVATNPLDEKIKELENNLANIEKKLEKQKNMYERDIIDIDELVTKTEKLREEEKEITSQLRAYKKSADQSEDITYIAENISSLWEIANEYERKQMMTTLFSQMVIDTKDEYKRGTGKPREILILSVK
ncbi:recombinase family protein [Bacillus sp. MSP5.4]|uniref:recombinase family protein n=1 Tax=Bacillus sp. MSP5.4 TaxID=1071069 RepID=UPI00068E61DA|nr:recombinase family protein [Bacillus sp. MSP5.4]